MRCRVARCCVYICVPTWARCLANRSRRESRLRVSGSGSGVQALMRMADLPYSGVTSFMIKTLLDKKYALPYRVVDALVDHFLGFRNEDRVLPVIWHLCMLTFVQRYKHDIRGPVRPPLLPACLT